MTGQTDPARVTKQVCQAPACNMVAICILDCVVIHFRMQVHVKKWLHLHTWGGAFLTLGMQLKQC